MRYYATVKGQKEPVLIELNPEKQGGFTLNVGGQSHPVDAVRTGDGTWSLRMGDEQFNVELEAQGPTLQVTTRGQALRLEIADERTHRLRVASGGFQVEGKQLILAPMPGKIVKVLVTQGQDVQEGQGLVVVEAMKMENELKSPKAGKVVELLAKEGATVENNAKLAVVE